jgi:hypothetical protein
MFMIFGSRRHLLPGCTVQGAKFDPIGRIRRQPFSRVTILGVW